MFLDTIRYATKYADRIVFIQSEDLDRFNISEDLDRFNILEGTPHSIGSDALKKHFILDVIATLGKDSTPYSTHVQESLWCQTQSAFLNQPHLGILINDAHSLFANRKQRTIIKLLSWLLSININTFANQQRSSISIDMLAVLLLDTGGRGHISKLAV